MKFQKNNLFVILAAYFLVFGSFTGCTESNMLSAIGEDAPTLQATGGCDETALGITDHEAPVAVDGDGDWDIVAEVWFTDFPDVDDPCYCTLYEYCVYLEFPQYAGLGYQVGIRAKSAPPSMAPTILVSNGNNGYIGHTPLPIQTSPHTDMTNLIGGVPAPSWHQICDTSDTGDPFFIFINYPDDLPVEDWPAAPVSHSSGICIVDIVGGGGSN